MGCGRNALAGRETSHVMLFANVPERLPRLCCTW